MDAYKVALAELDKQGYVSTLGMTEEVWLKLRESGIGASESAEAVGLGRWRTKSEWVERKLGLLNDTRFEKYVMQQKMKMGHIMEPVTAEAFAAATGLKVHNINRIERHPIHKHIFANLDRRAVGATPEQVEWLSGLFGYQVSGPGVVELKNTERSEGWGSPDDVDSYGGLCTSGEVPEDYYIQVQHQLAVSGYKWAFLVVTIGGWDVRWYPIARDDGFIDDLLTILHESWQFVLDRFIPPLDLSHPSALDLLKRRYPGTDGSVVELGNTLLHWSAVREDAKKRVAELNAVIKAADTQILHEAKNASVIMLPNGSAYTRKHQQRRAFEVKESSFVVLRHTDNPPRIAKAAMKEQGND